MNNTIWITWEKQRRTLELSKALGVELFLLTSKRKGLLRYIESIWKTLIVLIKERPRCLIVQNPSMVLACFVCILKPLFRYKVVVDRHSNFLLGKSKFSLMDKMFLLMSDFSIKKADLTIVTNIHLRQRIESIGGKGFILPDKLPAIETVGQGYKERSNIVTFICTYASDEPYLEVIQAASLLDNSIRIYMTGNNKKVNPQLFKNAPENLVVTGFLPDKEYDDLLNKSDIIMDFTKIENCMVCGAYESVALGKPLITSDTVVLKEYFNEGVVHIDHSPSSICSAIMKIYCEYDNYCRSIKDLRQKLQIDWDEKFSELIKLIKS